MITNSRFDVRCQLIREVDLESSGKSLEVVLQPRKALRKVLVTKCTDLSFMLTNVVVENIKVQKECNLTATVKYEERPDTVKVVHIFRE